MQDIADEHHEVLAESLEHEEVGLHIIDVLYILLDGIVYFLEERIAEAINVYQHLLAS